MCMGKVKLALHSLIVFLFFLQQAEHLFALGAALDEAKVSATFLLLFGYGQQVDLEFFLDVFDNWQVAN